MPTMLKPNWIRITIWFISIYIVSKKQQINTESHAAIICHMAIWVAKLANDKLIELVRQKAQAWFMKPQQKEPNGPLCNMALPCSGRFGRLVGCHYFSDEPISRWSSNSANLLGKLQRNHIQCVCPKCTERRRTLAILVAWRTMSVLLVSFSISSSDSMAHWVTLKSLNAFITPGHFAVTTRQTKPARKAQAVISACTSESLRTCKSIDASIEASRSCNALIPPLRGAARS